MTLLVQQMAALLKGGRTPARLWDELWLLHVGGPAAALSGEPPGRSPVLAPGSVRMLAAARAAAMRGSPVGAAIRSAGAAAPADAAGATRDSGAGEGVSRATRLVSARRML